MTRILRKPALALLGALAACGGDSTGPGPGEVPASLTVSEDSVAFTAIGAQATLTAEVRNAAGTVLDTAVAWSHLHPGVISIDQDGVLAAVGVGTDSVIASIGPLKDTVVVSVTQTAMSLSIAGPATIGLVGGQIQLTATVKDANNHSIPTVPVTWSSSNPALPVSPGGQVTAGGIDTATITATAGTLSATRQVAVNIVGPVGGPLLGAQVDCTGGQAGPFPCENIDLLAYLPLGGLGVSSNYHLDDLWGWTDPVTGTEWAIVGRSDGMAFVDLSDPTRPVFRAYLPATTHASLWHDVKVYDNHAFIVSDLAGQHGMQVFNLERLRDLTMPVTLQPDYVYTGVASAHNIVINEQTGFAYLVGSNSGANNCGGGLHMVDIRNPDLPVFAGCFADPMTGLSGTGYVHDAQCVVYQGPDLDWQGHEVCFGSNENRLSIADVTDKAAPVAIARVGYPQAAYTHQGWLTPDQRWFFMDDELDELSGTVTNTRTLIWDVADLDDPILAGEYLGPTPATDHNLYIAGDRLYASNYQYGIRVLDIANRTAPVQIGRFDTAPDEPDVPGFGGSWSNYPFFASGILVVTSQQQGLFVLRVR